MKNQKIVSRLNAVYFDIRPILVDLLQLVLSMYMSHVIMDNPFMGGATYLIFLCAKAAVSFINLSRRGKRPRRYLITAFMLLHMVSLIALLLWIIYPFLTADISSIKINILIGLLILRSVVPQYIGLKSIPSAKKMRLIHLWVNARGAPSLFNPMFFRHGSAVRVDCNRLLLHCRHRHVARSVY